MKNRKIIGFIIVLLFALLLVGCGKGNEKNNGTEQDESKVKYRITGDAEIEVGKGLSKKLNFSVYEGIKKVDNPLEYIRVSIDDGNIATFYDGEIGGLNEGKTLAKIECKFDRTVSLVVAVTVTAEETGDIEEHPITASFSDFVSSLNVGTFEYLDFSYECDGEVEVTVSSSNTDVAYVKKGDDGRYRIYAENKGEACISVIITSNTDLKEAFYDIQVFSRFCDIKYELDGGVLALDSPTQYEEGATTYLPDPVKPGYTFLGWTIGDYGTDYVTEIPANITGQVTVYANWNN